MFGIYASAAALVVAALVVGRAFLALLGRREWSWLSAPAGLALLVIVCQALIRLPGRALTSAIVLAALLVAALVYLRARPSGTPPRELVRQALPPALIVLAAVSLPFLLNDRTGVLGEGVYSNDHAAQLFWTEWLREGVGPEPRGIGFGYPLGPQSLAASVAEGIGASVEAGLTGLLVAIPVLTALAALAALADLPPWRRTAAASLVALPYLAASFYTQSAFKETAMALFVLGLALCLRELGGAGRQLGAGRQAATGTIVVLAVASVLTVSLPGLAWFAAALALWLAVERATGHLTIAPRRLLAGLRRAWPAAAAMTGAIVVVAVWQAGSVSAFFDRLGSVRDTGGRLLSPVSPREALGIWPAGDFRLNVAGDLDAWAATALALIALAVAAWWWLRRSDLALPATLAGAVTIYALARWRGGIHVEAKALAVMAPLLMLVIVRPLLGSTAALPGGGGRAGRLALSTLAAAFVLAAAGSTFLALRAAPVGTAAIPAELDRLRPHVEGRRVLFLSPDRFAPYRLRGALVESPGGYVASDKTPARRIKKWDQGRAIDFDTVTARELDDVRYAITTNAPYQSAPPSNFRPRRSTRMFTLWKRHGPTPDRELVDEDGKPRRAAGAVLDCSTPAGAELAERPGTAAVTAPPVVGTPGDWRPRNSFPLDGSAQQTLDLGRGRWLLSLQYNSPVALRLTAPGLHTRLPAALDGMFSFAPGIGPYWPAGELDLPRATRVRFTAAAAPAPWVARRLGVRRFSWVGTLAATRPGPPREVPLRAACGRYVDWYTLKGPQRAAGQAPRERASRR